MANPWTPAGGKWPQPAMVEVRDVTNGCAILGPDGGKLALEYLHPMPPAITPEQQAVLDAAERWEAAWNSQGVSYEVDKSLSNSVRALRAAQQSPDPVKELRKAWNAKWEPNWNDRMEDAIAALEKEKKS
jgi:hypothetical protein